MCLLLGTPFAAVWSQPGVVCSEKVTFDPLTRWAFPKRTPQGQFRGPPTYTHQVWRRSIKGPRRSRWTNKQTNRQTDRQTNAARFIVWFCTGSRLFEWWMYLDQFVCYAIVMEGLCVGECQLVVWASMWITVYAAWYNETRGNKITGILTLKVLVTTIDALGHF